MPTATATRRYVPVTLDGNTYCFENEVVKKIALTDECTLLEDPLPNGLAGEMEHSQQTVPVMRLRTLLGLETKERPEREHLVVVAVENSFCGYLVDDAQRAQALAVEDLLPLPNVLAQDVSNTYSGIARLRDDSRDDGHRGALILSHAGLLGMPSAAPSFPKPRIEAGYLLSASGREQGKLLLFDVPDSTLESQRTMLCFSATEVLEINAATQLIPVPGAKSTLHGLLPWRNQFVPILDLADRLKIGKLRPDHQQRIVIIRSPGSQLVGFYASDDIHSLRLPVQATPLGLPASVDRALIVGAFTRDDGVALVLPSTESLCDQVESQTAA